MSAKNDNRPPNWDDLNRTQKRNWLRDHGLLSKKSAQRLHTTSQQTEQRARQQDSEGNAPIEAPLLDAKTEISERHQRRFGFGGLCLIIGLSTFAIQQGCSVTGYAPSWVAGVLWFLVAIALIVLAIWFWDRTASSHWIRKLLITIAVVGTMAALSYSPVAKQYRTEHVRTPLRINARPSNPAPSPQQIPTAREIANELAKSGSPKPNRPSGFVTESGGTPIKHPKLKNPLDGVELENVAEGVHIDFFLEATPEVLNSTPTDNSDEVLRAYNAHQAIRITSQLKPEFQKTGWRVAFGQILPCNEATGAQSDIGFELSRHPYSHLTLVNRVEKDGCVIRGLVGPAFSVNPNGLTPLTTTGYALWPAYPDNAVITLRLTFTVDVLHAIFQGISPTWKSFVVDDPKERLGIMMGSSNQQWNTIKASAFATLNKVAPPRILIKTYLLTDGPAIVRTFSIKHHWENGMYGDQVEYERTSFCVEHHADTWDECPPWWAKK